MRKIIPEKILILNSYFNKSVNRIILKGTEAWNFPFTYESTNLDYSKK